MSLLKRWFSRQQKQISQSDIKALMQGDLARAGIETDKYFQPLEVVDGIFDALRTRSGPYLLQSGNKLKFVFAGPLFSVYTTDSMDYRLRIKVNFEPVGKGWREVQIWEGNISHGTSGGENVPQLSILALFSPGSKLDQASIVISQSTGEDLSVSFGIIIETVPRRKL